MGDRRAICNYPPQALLGSRLSLILKYRLVVNTIAGEVVEPMARTALFGRLQGGIMLGMSLGLWSKCDTRTTLSSFTDNLQKWEDSLVTGSVSKAPSLLRLASSGLRPYMLDSRCPTSRQSPFRAVRNRRQRASRASSLLSKYLRRRSCG